MFKSLFRRAHRSVSAVWKWVAPPTKRYRIGAHSIMLNREHLLPAYQAAHRLYDRFLPILCGQMDRADRWIIDVGANVGDTAVAIAQSCHNPILCIEADDAFYILLRQNVNQLLSVHNRTIRCLKALVGTGKFAGVLTSSGTTATLKSETSVPISCPLDELLAEAGIQLETVSLLKVDTDGYDGDVILSAPKMLAASRPVLFWENYFATREQLGELSALYQTLADLGYLHLWAFDNFGNLILEECTFKDILNLNRYVASQDFHRCTRTISYTDILAAMDNNLGKVRAAISCYRSTVIEYP